MWSRKLLREFSYDHASMIVDSLVTGIFPTSAQAVLAKTFSVCDSGLLGRKDEQKCKEGELDMNSMFVSVVDDFPDVLFAVINSKADIAQISMYNFMAPMVHATPGSLNPFQYFQLVNTYLARLDKRPNFVSYIVSSEVHCWTSKNWMATTDTTGSNGAGLKGDLTLSAWLSNFTAGSMSVQSQCSGVPMAPANWLKFSLGYCDAAQVSKVSGQVASEHVLLMRQQAGTKGLPGLRRWVLALIAAAVCALAVCIGSVAALRVHTGRRRYGRMVHAPGYQDSDAGEDSDRDTKSSLIPVG